MQNFGNLLSGAQSSVIFTDHSDIKHEVNTKQANPFLEMLPIIRAENECSAQLQLAIRNISEKPLYLEQAAILDVSTRLAGNLNLGGMTSWTILRGGKLDDLCDAWFEHNISDFYSRDYLVIGNRQTGQYVTMGFLSFTRQDVSFELKAARNPFKFLSLRAICDFSKASLAPGAQVITEPFYLNWHDAPLPAMQKYVALLAEKMPVKLDFPNITGWATWDYYLSKITEDDVLENAKWLAKHRDILPVEYIQIDHGFQKCEGNWLETNERFPHGLKKLSDTLRELGFKPGLWLCPFLIAPQSKVYQEHPDWVIRNQSGQALEVGGYAVSKVYALDCSIPEACEWVRALAAATTQEYRFDYIKLDGANYQGLSPLGVLRDKHMSKAEAIQRGLRSFCDGMAKNAVLLNTVPALSIGLAHAMRIGDDVGARWDGSKIDKHHGERDNYPGPGYIRRCIAATANTCFFHKKLWVNDPDYLIVRQKGCKSELSLEEARSWATITGLSNGLVMLGDRMSTLEQDRIELLRKTLPQYSRAAMPVDFFRRDCPGIFSLTVNNQTETWHVVSITNTLRPERTRNFELIFKDFGLADDERLHLFDFWNAKYLGIYQGKATISALPPRYTILLGIRKEQLAPQIIATDTHLTQGGIEIESCHFDAARLTLTIQTRPCGKSGRIFLYVPKGLEPINGECTAHPPVYVYSFTAQGAKLEWQFKGKMLKHRVKPKTHIKTQMQKCTKTGQTKTCWINEQEGIAGN